VVVSLAAGSSRRNTRAAGWLVGGARPLLLTKLEEGLLKRPSVLLRVERGPDGALGGLGGGSTPLDPCLFIILTLLTYMQGNNSKHGQQQIKAEPVSSDRDYTASLDSSHGSIEKLAPTKF
jgi:hypothetical protein